MLLHQNIQHWLTNCCQMVNIAFLAAETDVVIYLPYMWSSYGQSAQGKHSNPLYLIQSQRLHVCISTDTLFYVSLGTVYSWQYDAFALGQTELFCHTWMLMIIYCSLMEKWDHINGQSLIWGTYEFIIRCLHLSTCHLFFLSLIACCPV